MIDARVLIERQRQGFLNNDWQGIEADWHPDAELVSPGGRWSVRDFPAIMKSLASDYTDVTIEISSVFMSADERFIGLEWTYGATRRRDGARSVTPDAIIVELDDGLIKSWREYFDLSTSVELGEEPLAADKRRDRGEHL
jgi:ketosteroid isomerase-like protein